MKIYLKNSDHVLTEGLTVREFQCNCHYPECTAVIVKDETVTAYSKFRKRVGAPLHVDCGYRCPRHNLDEGGKELSRHMMGEAIDLAWYPFKNIISDPNEVIKALKEAGFTFVLYYKEKGFFHADTREV